jgi:hypothetical protein
MSARLAAALTTCQIALGVIPSPQILNLADFILRKPSAMAAAPIIDGAFRPQGEQERYGCAFP